MKPLRITMFLVAFLVLPLLVGQTMAATFTVLDSTWVPFAKISKNTIEAKALLGIQITGVTGCPDTSKCLEAVTLKSFITKAFSVASVQIYRESNSTQGLQVGTGSGYDQLVASRDTRNLQFDSNDTLTIGGIHDCGLVCDPDTNRFYVAITAHHDSVAAYPSGYNGQCLEVIILPTRLVLTDEVNPDTLYNRGGGLTEAAVCSTGFNPWLPGCRYRLCFDTEGPQYDIHLCVLEKFECKGDNTISQEDTVTICATGISPDIATPIIVIDSKKKFLLDLIQLKSTDVNDAGDSLGCWGGEGNPCNEDGSWNTVFIIPDKKNDATYPGIDADTGQWELCFYASDTAGNTDTICIQHAPNLTWRIDTRKPNIDSVQVQLVYDANGDGIVALGDSLQIIGWGLTNPWQPELEVDSMIADMRHFCLGWVKLDDVLNNNRVFRKRVKMNVPCCIDTTDCDLNVLTVWAWDNACNYDTLRKEYCGPVDLWPPGLGPVTYEYYFDYDTTFACIGIGDEVHIQAMAQGNDIVSVTADMKDAGIDELVRTAMPLPNKGGGVYDTIWTVTEPPIIDGKDANNSILPLHDSVYVIRITACDDADNCTTLVSDTLNRTLDTRLPRSIGNYFCADSVPCAISAISMPNGIIWLKWDKNCDEADAWYFYVYADDGGGYDSIGSTYEDEYADPNYNIWKSEPLAEGYYTFKIKTEDDCGNLGPFSCEVSALADATPPNACIVYPDSGLTQGYPFDIKARSEDPDIDTVCLWYRLWPNYPSEDGRSQWYEYGGCMDRYDEGFVFLEEDFFIHDYVGWVEVLPLSQDVIGNEQDTIEAYADACLDDDLGNLVDGHFLFYIDTTACMVKVVSVNDTISPQTSCGFNVTADGMNQIIINVIDAGADLFTIDVRAISDVSDHRIDYRNHVTMPCTLWVSVDNWDQGTQSIFVHVESEVNEHNCIPHPLEIELCVPPQEVPCIQITDPVEWQRIPCSKTDKTEVCITAETIPGCGNETVTQVEFRASATGEPPWYYIGEVLTSLDKGLVQSWEICWNNKEFIEQNALQDGDPVYLIAIAFDQYHMADTSHMVKVFLDCTSPNIQLLMEPIYYTCQDTTPKISCNPLTFKAIVVDTVVDYKQVKFYAKKHSDPDIYDYWHKVGHCYEPFNANLWSYTWEDPCTCVVDGKYQGKFGLCSGQLYDFRIGAEDQADNEFLDYDEDGRFDDSTFNMACALGAGMTMYVDGEAPQVAIAMVADSLVPVYNVNPSKILNGSGKAYVKAHDPITVWIVPEPSEDTCEVYKVEYWLGYGLDSIMVPGPETTWVVDTMYQHVSTGTVPNYFPITFNPWDLPEIIPHYEFEDGWWKGPLKAVLYDSLENSSEDIISLYILDIDPSQALIVEPLNDSYVWGDVALKVKALNAYEICQVVYEYRPSGDSVWYPILNGVSTSPDSFMVYWHTPLVTDGFYCLRARAIDCSNNWDENPPTICVHVANTPPSVVMDDPRQCSRTCPDDTVDTLGYVAGTVELYATATSTSAPVTKVSFFYKSIFGYPDTWALIATDDFPTNDKYSVLWDAGAREDGRYHLMARVYNAAGRYSDSDPIIVSVDNSGPFAQIISIDGNPFPDGMDITKGQVLDIELVAIDSTSNEGWTRCYNSGLTDIQMCIVDCDTLGITKCFDVTPVEDGFHHVSWNTSGLEFDGCSGCYYFYVKATDCLGNTTTSSMIKVYVSDVTAPVTTIGGFDGMNIYGYSDEKVSTLLFEYTSDQGTSWIPIGYSTYIAWASDDQEYYYGYYLYKTTWDPASLVDGEYWVRVISHDTCSNQDDSLAPIAKISVASGVITPYNPDLGEMTFQKNWCVGGMHGLVLQSCPSGTPVMFAKIGSSHFDAIEMQAHQQNTSDFAGSYDADEIEDGGTAMFFSSITVPYSAPPATGQPAMITYLMEGSFDVVEIKTDVGTHGIYQDGCVEVTIQGGAIDHNDYIWVAPTELEWAPVTQPNIRPIGDNNGLATYISFTECFYCCGWFTTHFGGDQGTLPLTAPADGYDPCCLNEGRYAKIKMCYDNTVTTDAAHLAVMWWDCEEGEFTSDHIFYPATVEGFDTENHTVEFATTCLTGPFAVVELIERQCDGSIVVNMLNVEPYCRNYTNATPQFKAIITDNVGGPSAIDESSIQFMADLFNPGELIRIYDGSKSGACDKWAVGFGSFKGAGYDDVSGIFRAGWNDSTYYNQYENCWYDYSECDGYYCKPLYPLAEGDHIAVVTAMNDQIQSCTDTAHITVDATDPWMAFADTVGAYVGKNPRICIYFNDALSGVDRNSIYIDVYGDETSSPDPNSHSPIATIAPAQLNWVNDTTVCLDGTFEYDQGGYLHLFVYGGFDCRCGGECASPDYYDYFCGIADCVGNRTDVFWQYYTVDAYGPTITIAYTSICDNPLKFQITDLMSGVLSVKVYEDSSLVNAIVQDEHNPDIWWYTPTDGAELVTIEAIDKLGNHSYKDLTLKADCSEPTVMFDDQYVCKNPTIKFWVTDPNGVNWSTVNVYITGCSEECYYYAVDLKDYIDTLTGEVSIDGCHLDCYDGDEVNVYVYSGLLSPINYNPGSSVPGPCDLDGNCGTYRRCSFVVDDYPPYIDWDRDGNSYLIEITDDKAGVDWSSVKFYEDGVLLTGDAVVFDTINGTILYTPGAFGKDVSITVTDKTGCNVATESFTTEEDFLAFGNPHNTPNPFDPNSEDTWIYPDLSKGAYVTMKIFDFAGEFVKEICNNEWIGVGGYQIWDGRTEGGAKVGNGTYLCYIHAKDETGSTKTAVVKITVLKKD